MGGRVFAVAGAKGGVGKTTTTLDLAAALATAGHAVVVVEADLAMANAVDFLDLPADPGTDPTLHDVLADTTPVSEATYAAPGGFDVVPSGVDLEGFAAAGIRSLGPVVDQLRAEYDAVLIDTPAGITRETLYPVEVADETVLVSTPRAASVRDVSKTVEMIERLGGRVRGIVFTKSGTGSAPPAERIASFLEVDLLGDVPEDDAVPASQDAGVPIVEHAPDSAAAAAYREIATRLGSSLVGVPGTESDDAGEDGTILDDGGET
ncbi:MAG: MinD/ParA family protein [Halobacteriales archaeon]